MADTANTSIYKLFSRADNLYIHRFSIWRANKNKNIKEESIQPVPEEGVGCEVGAEFELKKEKKELKPSLASSSFLTQEPKKEAPFNRTRIA